MSSKTSDEVSENGRLEKQQHPNGRRALYLCNIELNARRPPVPIYPSQEASASSRRDFGISIKDATIKADQLSETAISETTAYMSTKRTTIAGESITDATAASESITKTTTAGSFSTRAIQPSFVLTLSVSEWLPATNGDRDQARYATIRREIDIGANKELSIFEDPLTAEECSDADDELIFSDGNIREQFEDMLAHLDPDQNELPLSGQLFREKAEYFRAVARCYRKQAKGILEDERIKAVSEQKAAKGLPETQRNGSELTKCVDDGQPDDIVTQNLPSDVSAQALFSLRCARAFRQVAHLIDREDNFLFQKQLTSETAKVITHTSRFPKAKRLLEDEAKSKSMA